jgi:hypothetical protein
MMGANGITWATTVCLGDCFWKNFFLNYSLKILFKKIMLLCQGLCKIFLNICNFQKNWHLFINPFSVKKHVSQCLMSVFESFLLINFFFKLIHMFQWYIMNFTILKKIIYFQDQIKLLLLNMKKLSICYICCGMC